MVATGLVRAGATVMIASRKGEDCVRVAGELNAQGGAGRSEGFAGDVSSEADAEEVPLGREQHLRAELTLSIDANDPRARIATDETRHPRQCLHENLGHRLSAQVALGQDEDRPSGRYGRGLLAGTVAQVPVLRDGR